MYRNYLLQVNLIMVAKKTTTLNLRVDPGIKEAVKIAAEKEHRSVTNFIELLVRQHCKKVGITIPKQHGLFEEEKDER